MCQGQCFFSEILVGLTGGCAFPWAVQQSSLEGVNLRTGWGGKHECSSPSFIQDTRSFRSQSPPHPHPTKGNTQHLIATQSHPASQCALMASHLSVVCVLNQGLPTSIDVRCAYYKGFLTDGSEESCFNKTNVS